MIHFSLRKQLGQFHLHAEGAFANDRIVISGENGSGKTTLLRLLSGLETADQGSIAFKGQSWFDSRQGIRIPAYQRRAPCVFVEPNLLPWLSVEENIRIGVDASQSREDVEGAIQGLVRTLHLESVISKAVEHLSAGEAQRVALARVLLATPRMLLLDEPFSAQSERMRRYLQRWLVQLHEKLNFPIVVVTHDREEALRIGQRHWHMRNGRMIALETAMERPELLSEGRHE